MGASVKIAKSEKRWADKLRSAEAEARYREECLVEEFADVQEDDALLALGSGQQKRAKFPTSKAHFSAVFHSFWLIFGQAIVPRNGLEAWALYSERACAKHSR